MNSLRKLVVLALIIPACSVEESPAGDASVSFPDAGARSDAATVSSARLPCWQGNPPAASTDIVELTAALVAPSGESYAFMPGVDVQLFAGQELLETRTTDEEGRAHFVVATSMANLRLRASEDEFVDALWVADGPVRENRTELIAMLRPADLDAFYLAAEAMRDPSRSTLFARVVDCDREGLEGATLGLGDEAMVLWNEAESRWDPTLGLSDNGWGIAPNAPMEALLSARHEGFELPARSVTTTSEAIVYTAIDPYL